MTMSASHIRLSTFQLYSTQPHSSQKEKKKNILSVDFTLPKPKPKPKNKTLQNKNKTTPSELSRFIKYKFQILSMAFRVL